MKNDFLSRWAATPGKIFALSLREPLIIRTILISLHRAGIEDFLLLDFKTPRTNVAIPLLSLGSQYHS